MANGDIFTEDWIRHLEETEDEETELKCECGAKHTSRPNYHLQYCPMAK